MQFTETMSTEIMETLVDNARKAGLAEQVSEELQVSLAIREIYLKHKWYIS